MITRVLKGNLLESRAQTLVNTVNTVGVMGKGIALEFKRRFPDMNKEYEQRCAAGLVRLGQPYLHRRLQPPWIINFPTKEHWRAVSRLDAIEQGLKYLAAHIKEWEITSLAVPPLGCGHGQLEWSVVGPTLYRYLNDLPIEVELYAPFEVPDEQATVAFLASTSPVEASSSMVRLKPAWIAIAEAVRRINGERFAWPIGRTRFQKLVYFATEAGIPTDVSFLEGNYGPFAPDLKRILTRLVNNGVLREERRGNLLKLQPGPTFPDAQARFRDTLGEYERRIAKVVDLMIRLDASRTEIAASATFAARALHHELHRAPTELEVLAKVLQWKQRRRPPMDESDVAAAIRDMRMLGWIDADESDDLPINEEVLTVA